LSFDRFSSAIRLNINGDYDVKSAPGAILSIFLLIILVVYTVKRFIILVTKKNPDIFVSEFSNHYDS
jgi:hypothetical protein